MANINLKSLDEFIYKAHHSMKKDNSKKVKIHAERSGVPFGEDQRYKITYTCPATNKSLYRFEDGAMLSIYKEDKDVEDLLKSQGKNIQEGMFPLETEIKILTNYAELSVKNNNTENKKLYN